MDKELVLGKARFETFCCPDCYSNLDYSDSDLCLICSGCKKVFQVIDSIPDFRPNKHQITISNLEGVLAKSDDELSHVDVLAANIIFYDEIGERYELIPEAQRSIKNKRVQHRTREALEKIASKYSLKSSLLDMGCGTGFVMDMAKGIFEQTIGLDCSESIIRVAKNKGHRVCLADVVHTPFRCATFDMVATSAVLHHLYDPYQMIGESFRILKGGGIFFADFEPNYLFRQKINPEGRLYKLAEYIFYKYKTMLQGSVSKINQSTKYRKYLIIIESICEYHHYKTSGFKETEMKSKLNSIGFTDAEVIFHGNCESIFRPTIPFDERIIASIVQMISGNFSFLWDRSLKSNACHIAIVARKPKH